MTIRALAVARRHPWLAVLALAGPGLAWALAFVVAPAVVMVLMSLWQIQDYQLVHHWTLDNYSQIFTNALYTKTLLHTVETAAIVTGCSVMLAVPLAYVLVFKIRRFRTLWFGCVVVALWVGYLLRIYAWRIVLGNHGVLNGILQGVGLTHHPIAAFAFSRFAVVVALTHLCTPFALVPIFAVMEQIPRALPSAARDLYAGRLRTVWHVTLPLSAHGILAGASFAFILSFGDYYAPTLIGGPGSSLIGNIASSEFGASFQWPLGAALGLVMFGVVMLVLAVPFAAGAVLKHGTARLRLAQPATEEAAA